ncbi:MAG: helix-turn-helix domain-containing protein [Patescibacteria group bacterium]|jgi:sugar-specific transcriptional regulator TrmB
MEKVLKELGLTENEARVYLAFLKKGETMAATISRQLRMDKSSTYRAVETLIKKDLLISNFKKRGTTYTATNPEALNAILEGKQRQLSLQQEQLKEYIKNLKKQATEGRDTYILVETGLAAVQQSMLRTLESAKKGDKLIKEKYRLDFPYFERQDHRDFVNKFAQQRIKAGVAIQQIVDFAGKDHFAPIMKTDKSLLKEIRLMPEDMKKDFDGLRIAGDLVTIISFDKEKDYIVVTINDKFVAQSMKMMFDFIWNRAESYTTQS